MGVNTIDKESVSKGTKQANNLFDDINELAGARKLTQQQHAQRETRRRLEDITSEKAIRKMVEDHWDDC